MPGHRRGGRGGRAGLTQAALDRRSPGPDPGTTGRPSTPWPTWCGAATPPRTAQGSLHAYLSGLRSALEPERPVPGSGLGDRDDGPRLRAAGAGRGRRRPRLRRPGGCRRPGAGAPGVAVRDRTDRRVADARRGVGARSTGSTTCSRPGAASRTPTCPTIPTSWRLGRPSSGCGLLPRRPGCSACWRSATTPACWPPPSPQRPATRWTRPCGPPTRWPWSAPVGRPTPWRPCGRCGPPWSRSSASIPGSRLRALEAAVLRQAPEIEQTLTAPVVAAATPRRPSPDAADRSRGRQRPRRSPRWADRPSGRCLSALLDRAAGGAFTCAQVVGEPGIGKTRLVTDLGAEQRGSGVRGRVGTLLAGRRGAAAVAVAGGPRGTGWGRRTRRTPAPEPAATPAQVAFARWDGSCAVSSPRPSPARCCCCWRTCTGPTRPPCGRWPTCSHPRPRSRRSAWSAPAGPSPSRPGRWHWSARPSPGGTLPGWRSPVWNAKGPRPCWPVWATGPLPDSLLDAWHARSGGNPFFLVELARLGQGDPDRVPPTVRDVVTRRLSLLPERARQSLVTAAVTGTPIPARGGRGGQRDGPRRRGRRPRRRPGGRPGRGRGAREDGLRPRPDARRGVPRRAGAPQGPTARAGGAGARVRPGRPPAGAGPGADRRAGAALAARRHQQLRPGLAGRPRGRRPGSRRVGAHRGDAAPSGRRRSTPAEPPTGWTGSATTCCWSWRPTRRTPAGGPRSRRRRARRQRSAGRWARRRWSARRRAP